MRLALHAHGAVGRRAGRILLGERDVVALGRYGDTEARIEDRRTTAVRHLTGYLLLATDAPDGASFARIALDDGLHAVLSADVPIPDEFAARAVEAGLTVLVGADLGPGIAETLAAHEAARTTRDVHVRIAWTEQGSPLRRGTAVPFPEPVGPRWGRPVEGDGSVERVVVPVQGTWAGALATVTGRVGGRRVERTVGVADDEDHLRAIALAAGVLAVAEGRYGPGVRRPSDAAHAYLSAALRVGMDVASFTPS
jgi:hypothetical protein